MSVAAVTSATALATAATTMTKSLCFVGTNTDKFKDGQYGRGLVAIAQAAKAGEAFTQTDLAGANKLQAGVDHLGKAAKTSKTLSACGQTLKWLKTNINPLITVCVGAKIITSKNKEEALFEDGTGLGCMFAGEKAYKSLAKTNTAQNIFLKTEKYGNKIFKGVKGGKAGKICAGIIEGLGFVAASIGAYAGGAKLGGAVYDIKQEAKLKKQANFRAIC